MARKIRGDARVKSVEERLGIKEGAIRNPDGSDARSDKKLSTLRDDFEKPKKQTNKSKKDATRKS